MNKYCIICGKLLNGRQKVLCSIECRKERANKRSREWIQDNLEKKREYDRNRRQNNQKREKERVREWRQNNLEKVKESNSKYYQNNREKKLEYSQEYYQNNREKKLRRQHEYRQNNSEKIKESSSRYYRRLRGLPEDADLSKESSIEAIIREWLQDNNISFEQEFYINLEDFTWTYADFFIEPNICLYVDGDYWHGSNRPDIQERDERINQALENMGYNVIRITETDILKGNRPW